MCGITGFVGEGADSDLRRMTDALAHRGPDAAGYWADPTRGVHFGHRRLSILDLAGGAQPMVSADAGLVIVFNGEIYNFAELRTQLMARGHRFLTDHSDTEVLLNGFREWGADLPRRLNGMWAFVIYDRAAGKLFGSRDRFGKKPFYYTVQNGAFAFASELSALRLHPAVRSRLSRRALKKYFGYGYIPAPHTILENVFKLPGGHSLWVDTGTLAVRVEKYWDFVLEPYTGWEIPADPERAWGEELRSRLDTAVRRRLVADVPVGVFLSGGIDSSAVTALAARHVPAGRLQTFSIGFEEASFDESAHARRVAELFGTDHHVEILSIAKAHALLPRIAAQLDEPMGDSSLLPTYLLSEFTRRHVKVALGGDAGDELFAGYDPFVALRKAELYAKFVPRPVHQAVRLLAARLPVSHRNMSLDFRLKRTLRGLSHPPRLWLPVWMAPVGADELADLFHEPADLDEIFSEAIAAWEGCAQPDLIDRTLQFYTKLYLQDDILTKVDRATMMHGLEARAPFLDLDFIDFVRRIPSAWKYRSGQTKYILKQALAPLLPPDVLHRKKKGFGVPIGAWFKEGRLALDLAAPPPALDAGFLASRVAAHQAGRADERALLWNTWIFQAWSRSGTLSSPHG
ncbi:MAG TPA: asparagine synthase (glutamine-hydrolyzing) [Opitutaceae bacterium]|nr:asparagine synthase (glutamine-hydrolyzing) [Opitutaceae bacterium]